MKVHLIFIILLITDFYFAQTDEKEIIEHDLSQIAGVWEIDIKPSPKSQPYVKDFVIKPSGDNDFIGIFYDTKFENGKFNLNWERIYFSFSTKDKNSSYYHSGYIDGNKNSWNNIFAGAKFYNAVERSKKERMSFFDYK
jgi:hypothetical protein